MNSLKQKVKIDNRWIVPYNPILLLKYQTHINVEIVGSIGAVKYLYKYITKGADRVMVQSLIGPKVQDEIEGVCVPKKKV